MKTFSSILTICLFFGIFSLQVQSLQAQENYTTYQLSTPDNLSPLFLGSFTDETIYYGATPANSEDKPVLVFVHGFIDLANTWFLPGNEIYDRAYDDNYRSVFVAMTRGEGMWVNGEILAGMLEDITDHYGVEDVVIVAHSNGGKASDVAMFYENKSHLVDRVISLGTPFLGTGLADLAETPAFNWLVDFIGLGGGTSTSTTYYMEGVARPILDNEPDNQPNKFINFGAWGYNSGTTFAAPAMFVGGELLNTMGAGPSNGGNDGVTPYYSSTRPDGNPQWPGYCWWWWCNLESKYDHIDITHDYVVWDEITPFFEGNLNSYKMPQEWEGQFERESLLTSNFEIISTMDGTAEMFTVGENVGQVSIELMHQKEEDNFFVVNSRQEAFFNKVEKKRGHNGGINSTISLINPEKGEYTIESDAESFAAVVAYQNGPNLLYDNSKIRYNEGETIAFNSEIMNINKITEEASMTAVVIRKSDLMGNPLEDQAMVLEFESLGNGAYTYEIPEGLKEGVYNLTINAEGEDFRRSIVSGFVVMAAKQSPIEETLQSQLQISNYPNPVVNQTNITIEIVEKADTYLSLFDAYGRLVKVEKIENTDLGTYTHQWDLSEFNNGSYFLEVKNGSQKATNALLKIK